MQRILEGVSKFQREVFPAKKRRFEELANGQDPEVLFITCADSRIDPNLLTQLGPGELFICRNAGNIVPPYGEVHGGVSATIEYAVSVLNVKDIVVCGHTDCGAMKGILHPESVAELPAVRSWLNYGEVARRMVKENHPNVAEDAALEILTQENVVAQLDHLRTHPSVAARLARGRITLHAWVYHIHTGHVDIFDAHRGGFVPIDQFSIANTAPKARINTHRNPAFAD
jgi:carbonic anhydrase